MKGSAMANQPRLMNTKSQRVAYLRTFLSLICLLNCLLAGTGFGAESVKGPWPYAEGKALPIAKVRVEVQGQTAMAEVAEDSKVVSLTVAWKAGRTTLKTAFLNADEKVLCGAYYTDILLGNSKQ
jgi:hypothetical protein